MNELNFNLEVESQFWGFQFIEHAEFTCNLLDEPEFKARAALLLKNSSQYTTDQLALELLDLHRSILDVQSSGESVGNLWPSLVSHMIDEENWYMNLVNGRPSARDYACFTAKSAASAMALTSRLIDPMSPDVSQAVLASSVKFSQLERTCQTSYLTNLLNGLQQEIELSIQGSESLMFQQAFKVVSPKMIAHENREHIWFIQHF